MGNIQTFNIALPPIPSRRDEENSESENIQSKQPSQPLMSDEDIDKLIEMQRQQKLQNEKQNNINQPIHIPKPPEQAEPSKPSKPQDSNNQEAEQKDLDFNIDKMNINLDNIIKATHGRIEALIKNQIKVQHRVDLLEKFIRLDEKELALEIAKHEPNTQKVIGIRKSIVHQTELFDQTMDILLKFEGSIHTWTKTLMDVEKDKVSAYHKIKSINKEQSSADTDITDVLGNLNSIIKSDPTKVQAILGGGTLNISGYGGKKFQQS